MQPRSTGCPASVVQLRAASGPASTGESIGASRVVASEGAAVTSPTAAPSYASCSASAVASSARVASSGAGDPPSASGIWADASPPGPASSAVRPPSVEQLAIAPATSSMGRVRRRRKRSRIVSNIEANSLFGDAKVLTLSTVEVRSPARLACTRPSVRPTHASSHVHRCAIGRSFARRSVAGAVDPRHRRPRRRCPPRLRSKRRPP